MSSRFINGSNFLLFFTLGVNYAYFLFKNNWSFFALNSSKTGSTPLLDGFCFLPYFAAGEKLPMKNFPPMFFLAVMGCLFIDAKILCNSLCSLKFGFSNTDAPYGEFGMEDNLSGYSLFVFDLLFLFSAVIYYFFKF
mgnify:CR=1 FL=1